MPNNLPYIINLNNINYFSSRRTRARGGSESNLPMSDQTPNGSRQRCIPKSSQNSSRDSSFSDLSGDTKITLKQATSHPSLASK